MAHVHGNVNFLRASNIMFHEHLIKHVEVVATTKNIMIFFLIVKGYNSRNGPKWPINTMYVHLNTKIFQYTNFPECLMKCASGNILQSTYRVVSKFV